ncbi:MAG: hypothetical protein JWQ30_2782 [Sediminibacterium sp.]|nr:hypothetical protein [Sediminibacterium sp.]
MPGAFSLPRGVFNYTMIKYLFVIKICTFNTSFIRVRKFSISAALRDHHTAIIPGTTHFSNQRDIRQAIVYRYSHGYSCARHPN